MDCKITMHYAEFRKKEVVNIKNCEKLGKVIDFEMDERTGQICRIVVSKCFLGLHFISGETEYKIPYCHIRQIGPDLILVDLN